MELIADLHIHSKYSRATSPRCDLEGLSEWARIKGIGLLGTGDFTHPKWMKELRQKLKPAEEGLFGLNGIRFVLQTEVSNIFRRGEKLKKMHTVVFAPSFEIADQISDVLKKYGNLEEDGRPTLSMDVTETYDILLSLSEDIVLVPAHCLPPSEKIHTKNSICDISKIKTGDVVLTHRGKYRKVSKTYKRNFKGKLYRIKPYYFSLGTETTPEHPFYAIKIDKNACATFKTCKPICSERNNCRRRNYEKYQMEWVQAKDLEVGDVLIFPRVKKTQDKKEIRTKTYLNARCKSSRLRDLPKTIPVNKEFCRLVGYYLAEGYSNGRDAVLFCFNSRETKYMQDVKALVKSLFRLDKCVERRRSGGVELTFHSKYLMDFFSNLCYESKTCRANTKRVPPWMLFLPEEKQIELFRGWWRGDRGYTVSCTLMNQMKLVLLRLGAVPNIGIEMKDKHNLKSHFLGKREIKAKHNSYIIHRASFLEDKFGLLKDGDFKVFESKLARRHGWMDEDNLYLPIRKIETRNYRGDVFNLEVAGDNSYVSESAAVHNCWTPWFGIFGSKSGFDSLEEALGDRADKVFAIETGLSSDPQMNWMLSSLDRISLISNSDAHSPQKLGREANLFSLEKPSYKGIMDAIRTRKGFTRTYEFYPEEGKYHWDGHRNCGVHLSPKESIKYGNICPVCKKPLTVGVLHRVVELADRGEDAVPEGAVPFTHFIPLSTIISVVRGRGEQTKQVRDEYFKLVNYFGTEFAALQAGEEQLGVAADAPLARGIVAAREGKVSWRAGYDGVFGEFSFSSSSQEKPQSQTRLGDF